MPKGIITMVVININEPFPASNSVFFSFQQLTVNDITSPEFPQLQVATYVPADEEMFNILHKSSDIVPRQDLGIMGKVCLLGRHQSTLYKAITVVM